jgi:hypothetical protein
MKADLLARAGWRGKFDDRVFGPALRAPEGTHENLAFPRARECSD